MHTTDPLVSVLMTAYNRSDYISEAIESVLDSTYSNFELIIVDDCSSDDTYQIAQQYADSDNRVRVYKNEMNLGDYPNRNMAASYAKGKYIKYVDSDNVIYRFGLAVMVDGMEKFPEAGYGLLSISDPERPFPVCISPEDAYEKNFEGKMGFFGRAPDSAIIKKTAFDDVRGFSGKNLIGDLEMWLKLSQHHSLVLMQGYLGWDRTHPGQQKNIDPLIYQHLRDEVTTEYLESVDCPLDSEKVARIFSANKRSLRKQSALLLGKFKFGIGLRTLFYSLRL